ncbi:helix-turn-helix transcriptional regulator [Actinoplanes derwentensis]|nr:response regulator transcription factor [Actinoplanes derwentensis]GID85757.1 DNA-binding response regulator [Actinoplanes derwentensis]
MIKTPVPVAVVSASATMRAGLVRLAAQTPALQVTHQLAAPARLPPPPAGPSLAIVDVTTLRTAVLNRRLRSLVPARTRTVLVCRPDEPPSIPEAIRAGVRAMILPDGSAHDLWVAVDTAVRDSVYISAGLVGGVLGGSGDEAARLCPREVEALRMLAEGLTNPAIGQRMGVAVATADTYARNIRTKLNVGTRTQLVARAIELGYLTG